MTAPDISQELLGGTEKFGDLIIDAKTVTFLKHVLAGEEAEISTKLHIGLWDQDGLVVATACLLLSL